jgi:hypothetical protein
VKRRKSCGFTRELQVAALQVAALACPLQASRDNNVAASSGFSLEAL